MLAFLSSPLLPLETGFFSWHLGKACFCSLNSFRHYLTLEMHSNSTGLNSYKIYSDVFCSIYAGFLHCHYLQAVINYLSLIHDIEFIALAQK